MKKVILIAIALLMGAPVYADTFAGIYGVHTETINNTAGDYSSNISTLSI